MNDPVMDAPVADLKRSRRHKEPLIDLSKIDCLPPHSIEAEQCVLGCVLLEVSALAPIIACGVGRDTFYDLRHAAIYEAMCELMDSARTFDLVTLAVKLKDKNQLDIVGGMAYLASLPDCVPSAANHAHYSEIMLEKEELRKTISRATQFVGEAFSKQDNSSGLLDSFRADIIAGVRQVNNGRLEIKPTVHAAVDEIEQRFQNQGVLNGLPTGIPDLDKLLDGMKNKELIVIAARPSVGKTSIGMQITEHLAVDKGIPVGVFSLEMSGVSLVKRQIASRARVNLRDVSTGFLTERAFPRIAQSATELSRAPIHIDESTGLTVTRLRSKARMMVAEHGVKIFVIDYLQKILGGKPRYNKRSEEVADVCGNLKDMAKELDVPVVVLAQMNRESDKAKGTPTLSSLRESGDIEQDADVVGLLYREAEEEDEDNDRFEDILRVNLLIAKQRNGPTGNVCLMFLKNITRFESAARITGDDIPQ